MARRWKVLTVAAVAVFIGFLDVTIVNVAFPAIQGDFSGSSRADLSWVLNGYNVVFVPFDRNGKSGAPTVFADGFAALNQAATPPGPARYRPIGIAEGPDGSLYVADSQKGRIWRIAYEKEGSRTTAGGR